MLGIWGFPEEQMVKP